MSWTVEEATEWCYEHHCNLSECSSRPHPWDVFECFNCHLRFERQDAEYNAGNEVLCPRCHSSDIDVGQCEECAHPLHDPGKCEVERGDGYRGAEFQEALGPCTCGGGSAI